MNASGGPNCRGLPNVPTKQNGGSWYHTPFLVTDNAYVPYQPNTELQFDAPSTVAVPVQRSVRGKGRVLMAGDRALLKVSVFTVGDAVGGGIPHSGVRRVPICVGQRVITPRSPTASRLKAGQDVRIAGVPVGAVNKVIAEPG